ncbi:putative myosin-binding protein 5 [Bidens hawaiensis]|uniref:putative myosin-binding protein 5 n=1 Tax=Bidens hawaiensis TaxID=980011 RepID=UPI004049CECC
MAATNEFMHHLSMAACEWFLMLLMYLEAALGLILTRFAHQCELQTPCLYCFRFDHVFGDKPDSYFSHFCNKHQAEVSCLIACDLHHKLSDVREMCDDCFMSIVNGKRDQVSKFKPFLNKNLERAPSSTGLCSCCKRPWKPKPRPQVKLGVKKLSMHHPPLPGRYRRRSFIRKARDKISGTMTPCSVASSIHVDTDIDALSDSGCADLKFNSCSSESGDSFYEIECENDGFEDFSCVIIQKAKSFNTTRSKSLTSSLSSSSSASTKHDVEQNGSPEFTLDLHSVNDDVEQNGSPEFNQDLHSVNDDVASSYSSDKHEGYESPGTHSVGEIKNDCDMEKLKRQMEHDRKQLRLLHKELEEERNAAAIAADEAMAMITRLQEEKSSLHMEALQYLRMMDEQAEYDMEALDKANDLITEKDKDIQDLEAELEFFRSRYDDETDNFKENHTVIAKAMNLLDSRVNNNNPDLNLEDEKNYILQSLSESEKKFSNGNIGDKSLQQSEIENEISDLNDWLEAVESDRDFLEHACNAVQSHVGSEFIQEIARHLHDLRRARFDRRYQTVD